LNKIKSLENYYKDQFDLLTEKLNNQKRETLIRDGAQMNQLKSERHQMRRRLVKDIKQLQNEMINEDDYIHWRQVDSNNIMKDLLK
jgi:centrosomal protein CEP95